MATRGLRRAAAASSLLASCLAGGEARAAVPASERAALIALYDGMGGTSWVSHTNWGGPAGTECSWYGVTCDGSASHVTGLTLSFNHLVGPIPAEIGGLPELQTLEMAQNCCLGAIAPEIGNLTKLRRLNLYHSELEGQIPDTVGNLVELQELFLAWNGLSGAIPPQLGALTSLRTLTLDDTYLSGAIPPELGNLASLSIAYLNHTLLTGAIPPQLGNLSNLKELQLQDNQLSGAIPASLGNLTNLTSLQLQNNQLSGAIPPELGKLSSLYSLHLEHNQLGGAIPMELGGLTNVLDVFLNDNSLTGSLPPELGQLTHVSSLDLQGNQLSGDIPASFGRLTGLYELDLTGNHLSGAIPPDLCDSAAPRRLLLSGNQLSGRIPTEIGKCRRLLRLDLSGNQLSGPVPTTIGYLALLEELILQDNQLSGSIPATIGNLSSMWTLTLDRNRLSGAIPTEIGQLHLRELGLSANQLRGPVPASLLHLYLTDNASDFRWNALFTDDPTVRAFLDAAQIGGDWVSTQTTAPTGLSAGAAAPDSVPLSWTSIPYTGDAGRYRLWYGTVSGGPYAAAGVTADKTVPTATVTGLSPGINYYFVADTVTDPHASNQNTVVSERGAEISATTTTGGQTWFSLDVVRAGPGTVSSLPEGIACGGVCAASYAPGTPVSLTATPDPGSAFLGWTGACSDSAPTCGVTMDSARAVTAAFSPPATAFYTVTPCRLFDSRDPGLGGPSPLVRLVDTAIPAVDICGIPVTAKALSLNVTVVSATAAGNLRLYASGSPRPATSTINYAAGQTRANNTVIVLGADGRLAVFASQPSGTVHVVLDVNGYFQ
jgi:Leucine-rich repeat (LRR) protein